jgi:AraC-like DNA-binding protein/ketosteroid isomerase-like protein
MPISGVMLGVVRVTGNVVQIDQLSNIIQSYFDAWNRNDSESVASFFCKQGVYVDTALNQEYRGEEIKQYVDQILSETTGLLSFSIIEQPVINNDVVFLRSSLKFSRGDHDRQFESAELFKFLDGKITLLQTYYDLTSEKETLSQPDEKYAKSGLDEQRVEEIKLRLEKLMQEQQLFKDPSLKLQGLSESLNIRRNQLSLIINLEYKMKFFDFINKDRLDAFINELHLHSNQDINITSLAYDVGFSSSSVFYKIFKRYQDISPRQYLKKYQVNTH